MSKNDKLTLKDVWDTREDIMKYFVHPLVHYKIKYGYMYLMALIDAGKYCDANVKMDFEKMAEEIYYSYMYRWLTSKSKDWL